MVILSYLAYLGEVEPDSQNVLDLHNTSKYALTTVPRSVLPIFNSKFAVLTRFDFKLEQPSSAF